MNSAATEPHLTPLLAVSLVSPVALLLTESATEVGIGVAALGLVMLPWFVMLPMMWRGQLDQLTYRKRGLHLAVGVAASGFAIASALHGSDAADAPVLATLAVYSTVLFLIVDFRAVLSGLTRQHLPFACAAAGVAGLSGAAGDGVYNGGQLGWATVALFLYGLAAYGIASAWRAVRPV